MRFTYLNLPKQIEDRLGITLQYRWNRIPTELNEILRAIEVSNPSCYATYFKPNQKLNWGNYFFNLNKLEQLINCI